MDKFKDITKLAEKALKEMTSKTNLRVLGEDAKKLIQKRTRLGGGVKRSEGPRVPLKNLSKDYRKQRKRLKKKGKLDRTTTPAKSNLTQTGQMLKDIRAQVKRGFIRLNFRDRFSKQKAKWTQNAGRDFFNLTKAEVRQLRKKLRLKLEQILKKI